MHPSEVEHKKGSCRETGQVYKMHLTLLFKERVRIILGLVTFAVIICVYRRWRLYYSVKTKPIDLSLQVLALIKNKKQQHKLA